MSRPIQGPEFLTVAQSRRLLAAIAGTSVRDMPPQTETDTQKRLVAARIFTRARRATPSTQGLRLGFELMTMIAPTAKALGQLPYIASNDSGLRINSGSTMSILRILEALSQHVEDGVPLDHLTEINGGTELDCRKRLNGLHGFVEMIGESRFRLTSSGIVATGILGRGLTKEVDDARRGFIGFHPSRRRADAVARVVATMTLNDFEILNAAAVFDSVDAKFLANRVGTPRRTVFNSIDVLNRAGLLDLVTPQQGSRQAATYRTSRLGIAALERIHPTLPETMEIIREDIAPSLGKPFAQRPRSPAKILVKSIFAWTGTPLPTELAFGYASQFLPELTDKDVHNVIHNGTKDGDIGTNEDGSHFWTPEGAAAVNTVLRRLDKVYERIADLEYDIDPTVRL